jgi:glucose-6-phosphate dehydrogenase assembly protein OpcA
MIVDLPDTDVSSVSKTLVKIRDEGGAVALGRVLTLVISTSIGNEEQAIEAATHASREHPMRVIVVSKDITSNDLHLDAQIRVGGDAGASEVIVLRAYGEAIGDEESLATGLLLSDAPVVAWWPNEAPDVVAASPLGRFAQRRITDASAQADPQAFLHHLANTYTAGDTDFAWTRLTIWRAQLAAVLDQPPYDTVTAIHVSGSAISPGTTLLAAWLQLQLQVPVKRELFHDPSRSGGVLSVRLTRKSGMITLERSTTDRATLIQPNQPAHDLPLPRHRNNLHDCLAEELRRLAPDDLYGAVLTHGLRQLEPPQEPQEWEGSW